LNLRHLRQQTLLILQLTRLVSLVIDTEGKVEEEATVEAITNMAMGHLSRSHKAPGNTSQETMAVITSKRLTKQPTSFRPHIATRQLPTSSPKKTTNPMKRIWERSLALTVYWKMTPRFSPPKASSASLLRDTEKMTLK